MSTPVGTHEHVATVKYKYGADEFTYIQYSFKYNDGSFLAILVLEKLEQSITKQLPHYIFSKASFEPVEAPEAAALGYYRIKFLYGKIENEKWVESDCVWITLQNQEMVFGDKRVTRFDKVLDVAFGSKYSGLSIEQEWIAEVINTAEKAPSLSFETDFLIAPVFSLVPETKSERKAFSKFKWKALK